jgi:hypothetical protein
VTHKHSNTSYGTFNVSVTLPKYLKQSAGNETYRLTVAVTGTVSSTPTN